MQRVQLYEKIIHKWGKQGQYEQMIEECAELITALKHYQRGKIDSQAVIDEIADVTLMLGQLTWMFGEEQVNEAITSKLEKLNTLLAEE